jgi:hypothetical protein
MTLRMTPKQAKKLAIVVEKKNPRRMRTSGVAPGFTWNTASLDAPPKKGRFATSDKERRTVDGVVFDSLVEAKRWSNLKLLERAGLISQLTNQPSWAVQINGQHFCTYTADSSYFCHDRKRLVIEEVKTSGTEKDTAYRLRKKAAELQHGIRVEVFLA